MTDIRTDGQTDGETALSMLDRVCIPCSAVKMIHVTANVHSVVVITHAPNKVIFDYTKYRWKNVLGEVCPGGGRMSDIFYTDSVTKQMNSFLHNV